MGKVKTKDMGEPVEKEAAKAAETKEATAKETKKKVKVSKRSKKQTKYRSKDYQVAAQKVDRFKTYPIEEAVKLAQDSSYSEYDGSLEIHINTKIKGLRGLVSLPFVSGKKLRIAAFGKGAAESGADIVGDEELIAQIGKSKINFDVLITTSEWMPKLAPLARILGPRGLMPSPKNATIADNLAKAIQEIKVGKTEYKSEPSGRVIHLSLGKISQPQEELSQNVRLLLGTIGKSRIAKVVLSPSLGPGIKVDYSSI